MTAWRNTRELMEEFYHNILSSETLTGVSEALRKAQIKLKKSILTRAIGALLSARVKLANNTIK